MEHVANLRMNTLEGPGLERNKIELYNDIAGVKEVNKYIGTWMHQS